MEKSNTYGGKFCSPDEQQITTLGTGYIANFLSGGEVERAGATLTNKRIYFSGNTFSFDDKGHLLSIRQRKIVNVRDVTGVGYTQYNPIQYITWSVIASALGLITLGLTMQDTWDGTEPSDIGLGGFFIGLLISIVLVVLFFLYRKTLLSIEYAGGNIAFDARWLQPKEEDIFIRNIHLAKDKLYSMSVVEQGFAIGDDITDEDDIPDL